MREVIWEKEHIGLTVARSFYGESYLLFEPFYPWSHRTQQEREATMESLEAMFRKYISILTDEEIVADYYSVENGG